MKRVLSVWLPRWAIDRRRLPTSGTQSAPQSFERVDPPPLVLAAPGRRGMVLTAVDERAEHTGLMPGMRLVDARALVAGITVEKADPVADQQALMQLGLWCGRFTPRVACDGADGLLLDVTGCSHLFGGEQAMMQAVSKQLTRLGLETRLGLADTPGAAGALARFAPEHQRLVKPGKVRAALKTLPVEALGVTRSDTLTLRHLGLNTIGAITRLPRIALERRFPSCMADNGLLQRLDQVLGNRNEHLSPLVPPPIYRWRLDFAEPVMHREGLETALANMMARLTVALKHGQHGARRLALWCFGIDGSMAERTVAVARPTRDTEHLQRLFAGELETVDPGFGIDAIVLHATLVEPLETKQPLLDGSQQDNLDPLIDRLVARLGAGAVLRPVFTERRFPEQAERFAGPGEDETPPFPYPGLPPRPFRLFERPEPLQVIALVPDGPPRLFIWRRVRRRITRAAGPERIAPEWWIPDTDQATRDYWRVEDTDGHRYWLYRTALRGNGVPRWFLHGLYG